MKLYTNQKVMSRVITLIIEIIIYNNIHKYRILGDCKKF